MRIVDLAPEYETIWLHCLEPYSEMLRDGVERKRAWYQVMRERGLIVKLAIADDGAVAGMVQSLPIEQTWVRGEGLHLILCIWVHGHDDGIGDRRGGGMGRALLQAIETEIRLAGAIQPGGSPAAVAQDGTQASPARPGKGHGDLLRQRLVHAPERQLRTGPPGRRRRRRRCRLPSNRHAHPRGGRALGPELRHLGRRPTVADRSPASRKQHSQRHRQATRTHPSARSQSPPSGDLLKSCPAASRASTPVSSSPADPARFHGCAPGLARQLVGAGSP